MPIVFQDLSNKIEFEYHDQLPDQTFKIRLKGDQSAFRLNITALHLYSLYRNSIFDSYSKNPDLATDIKERKKQYEEPKESKFASSRLYQSPVYHYAIAASLDAMKEWKDSTNKMKCYIAYETQNGKRVKIGFVHFQEKTVNNKNIVYIAQAGVLNPGQHIGRHLMECVLAHYPADTEFYILTRIFNTEAKNLYQKRLSFTPITSDEIQKLGYDERYCGFRHTTSQQEINVIESRKLKNDLPHDVMSNRK